MGFSLLKTQKAHHDGVMCLSTLRRDGHDVLVTGGVQQDSGTAELKLWDVEGAPLAAHPPGTHKDAINCITSLSEEYLLTSSDDNSLKVWQVGSYAEGLPMKERERFKHKHGINKAVVVNAAEGLVAGCDDGGDVLLWRLPLAYFGQGKTGGPAAAEKVVALSAGSDALNCAVVVSGLLWTGGDDGFLRRWHVSEMLDTAHQPAHPSLNIMVLDVDDTVFVNVLALNGGALWCGIGIAGAGIFQKRDAVLGALLQSVQTNDWARALVFPNPSLAVGAFDDGTIVTFATSAPPVTSVERMTDNDAEDQPETEPAPEVVQGYSFGGKDHAIMGLAAVGTTFACIYGSHLALLEADAGATPAAPKAETPTKAQGAEASADKTPSATTPSADTKSHSPSA